MWAVRCQAIHPFAPWSRLTAVHLQCICQWTPPKVTVTYSRAAAEHGFDMGHKLLLAQLNHKETLRNLHMTRGGADKCVCLAAYLRLLQGRKFRYAQGVL